jgi:hypothetical protein
VLRRFMSQVLTSTWHKMKQHRNHRLKHGLYSSLLIAELLLSVAFVFFTVSGAVYCRLRPGSEPLLRLGWGGWFFADCGVKLEQDGGWFASSWLEP